MAQGGGRDLNNEHAGVLDQPSPPSSGPKLKVIVQRVASRAAMAAGAMIVTFALVMGAIMLTYSAEELQSPLFVDLLKTFALAGLGLVAMAAAAGAFELRRKNRE